MKRIEVHIPKELLDKIDAMGEDMNAALKQFAQHEAAKIMAGLQRDYNKVLLETMRREYKPQRRIRVVGDHPPYLGVGIITTLHAGRKRK